MSDPAPRLVDLAHLPRWVAWRNEERRGKVTKVPYGAHGLPAKANDPGTWLLHDVAATLAEKIVNGKGGGCGIELGPCGGWHVAGVDLDTCRDAATGAIAAWAQEIV